VRDIVTAATISRHQLPFRVEGSPALEVFARRIEPVNGGRLRGWMRLPQGCGPQELTLNQILDAMIRPVLGGEYRA